MLLMPTPGAVPERPMIVTISRFTYIHVEDRCRVWAKQRMAAAAAPKPIVLARPDAIADLGGAFRLFPAEHTMGINRV